MATKAIFEAAPARELKPKIGAPALVADLDGTVLKTDLLLESLLARIKQQPLCLFFFRCGFLRVRLMVRIGSSRCRWGKQWCRPFLRLALAHSADIG